MLYCRGISWYNTLINKTNFDLIINYIYKFYSTLVYDIKYIKYILSFF